MDGVLYLSIILMVSFAYKINMIIENKITNMSF